MFKKTLTASLLMMYAIIPLGASASDIVFAPLVIEEKAVSEENTAVDSSLRPEWTSYRKFASTRVYVQKEEFGEVGVEQWVRATTPRGGKTEYLFSEEVEVGLGNRLQLDLYKNFKKEAGESIKSNSTAIELRYAFADWDVIFGNPAIYVEYKQSDVQGGRDKMEAKLLFGGDLTETLHWGTNISYEEELVSSGAVEKMATVACSKTLIDNKLSVGVEAKYLLVTEANERDIHEFDVGPSVQWKPTKDTHVDFTAFRGMTKDSPMSELWLIIGYNFTSTTKNKIIRMNSVRQ